MADLLCCEFGPAAAQSTTRFRRTKARLRPLTNKISFHLRERGHDVKEEAARRRRGVDAVGYAHKLNSLALKGGHHIDELSNGPSEPVKFPDDEGIAGPEV